LSDPKRTGSRDISELKQRLGLKKGGAPATGQTRGNGATGGVVPPPGLNLPPPPGAAPPQPVIPNAADDPFGAMNAMAAVGTVQRAPEIVIVNDGRPVENVGHQSVGQTVAKIAVPALIALIAGVAVGKIGTSKAAYNDGLSDIRAVLGEQDKPGAGTVLLLKSQLSEIRTLLEQWKTENDWKPSSSFDKKLEAAAQKLDLKSDVFMRAKQNSIDGELSTKIMSFYAGVAAVRSIADWHINANKWDDLAFKARSKTDKTVEQANKDKLEAATLKDKDNAYLQNALRYGVLVQAPSDTEKLEFGAKIVELGPPYCSPTDKNPNTSGKCPDDAQPSGFAYRAEPSAPFIRGDVQVQGVDAIPSKKILLLLPTGIRDSLIVGADGVASEAYYRKRLEQLFYLIDGKPDKQQGGKGVGGLLDEGNKLVPLLQTEASKKSQFSFFM
jgi:hypothetical protein